MPLLMVEIQQQHPRGVTPESYYSGVEGSDSSFNDETELFLGDAQAFVDSHDGSRDSHDTPRHSHRHRPVSTRLHAFQQSWRSRTRLVLLFVVMAATGATIFGSGFQTDLRLSEWGHGQQRCGPNLYDQQGYIFRKQNKGGETEIRWIPYTPDNTYTSEFESVADIYNTSVYPSEADIAASPPAYSNLLEVDPESPLLSFARNKTIVLIGDSHDRKNLQSLCSRVPGAIEHGTDGHHNWTCSLPSLGTHFVLLFHYGLMREDETYRAPHDQLPNSIEQRVDQVLLPMLQGFTPSDPSLVIFQSGFWDLRYWGMRALAEGANEPGHLAEGIVSIRERPLLWSELRWYRQRFGDVLGALHKTFPDSQITTRTIQSYRGNEHARNVAVFELNESIKAMSRLYHVPTMRWSELLQGSVAYADEQHFEIGGLPYKLWINMVLYYLDRSLKGCLGAESTHLSA